MMIVSQNPMESPYRRRTVHKFTTHVLSGSADSDVAWWNPGDHGEPIPWRINRAFFTRVNSHVKDFNYTFHAGDPALVTPTLELWGVDSSGAEKIIIFEAPASYPSVNYAGAGGGTSHVDTEHVSGLKWKLHAPSYTYNYELMAACFLLWSFKNLEQTEEVVWPLI